MNTDRVTAIQLTTERGIISTVPLSDFDRPRKERTYEEKLELARRQARRMADGWESKASHYFQGGVRLVEIS